MIVRGRKAGTDVVRKTRGRTPTRNELRADNDYDWGMPATVILKNNDGKKVDDVGTVLRHDGKHKGAGMRHEEWNRLDNKEKADYIAKQGTVHDRMEKSRNEISKLFVDNPNMTKDEYEQRQTYALAVREATEKTPARNKKLEHKQDNMMKEGEYQKWKDSMKPIHKALKIYKGMAATLNGEVVTDDTETTDVGNSDEEAGTSDDEWTSIEDTMQQTHKEWEREADRHDRGWEIDVIPRLPQRVTLDDNKDVDMATCKREINNTIGNHRQRVVTDEVENVTLKVLRIDGDDASSPRRATRKSEALDLMAPTGVTITPNSGVVQIPLGFKIKFPEGTYGQI